MIVAHLRKSRADLELEALGEMETLAKHEKILDELAARNGLPIEKYYREVVSGETLDARPVMRDLLDDLYARKITHIYTVEIERLSRGSARDQGVIFEALKYSGAKLVTPIKTYDPNDPFDEEYLEFALFMSRREYKTITRRMHAARLQAVKEGNYLGTYPPYGYDIWKPERKTRTLKPNNQAEYIQLIFKWFVEDRLTAGAIARKLTAMGVPTQKNKPEWGRGSINEILKNDTYTGKIRWFKRQYAKEYRDGHYEKIKPRTERKDLLIVEGKHDAIIDQSIFDKAQTLFVGVPISTSKEVTNPLAGLLKCSKCGRAISRHPFKKARDRYCHTKGTTCKMKSAACDDVMEAVIEGLGKIISDFEFKMTNEAAIEHQKQKEKEVEALKTELAAQIAQRANQFELLEKKIYTEAEFMERRAIVTKRMEEIEQLLANTSVEVIDYTEEVIRFSQVLESLKNPNIPAKHKNDLLKDLIERIEYTNECEKVALNIISR